MRFFRFLFTAAIIIFSQGVVIAAYGADDVYPSKPIEFIITAPRGGGADVSLRILAEAMAPILGQKLNIVNKPGNGAIDGLTEFTKAAPDGYSLVAVWNGPLTATPQVRNVAYTLDSFSPIASTFESDYVLCARNDFPAQTGQALINILRQRPLGYSYGTEGKGGSGYFAAEQFFDAMGAVLRSESFNGTPEVAKNFADKKIDFYFGTSTAILGQVKSGVAKCLIITGYDRPGVLPQAATLQELDTTSVPASLWRLVLAPKGIPADRAAVLESAIRKAMETPAVRAFLIAQGERANVQNGAQTMARLKAEFRTSEALADKLLLIREPVR